MSFSCSIYQGKKDLTSSKNGVICYRLSNLGSDWQDDTQSPNSTYDFRSLITIYPYAHQSKDAAQACFKRLQDMAQENLDSLSENHCCTCKCPSIEPKGWSAEALKALIAIDPETITKING